MLPIFLEELWSDAEWAIACHRLTAAAVASVLRKHQAKAPSLNLLEATKLWPPQELVDRKSRALNLQKAAQHFPKPLGG